MIVVKLRGGLGNQMFQYALGRTLAKRNNTSLALDLSVYYNSIARSDYTLRGYELGVFNINERLILPPRLHFLTGKLSKRLSNLIHKTRIISSYKIVEERHFHYDKHILESGDNFYINGYWHSEKYFKDINPELKDAFRLKVNLSSNVGKYVNEIKANESIGLHIRRGDYLINTWAQETYHSLDLSYYQKAVEIIQKGKGLLNCYVFSDDPEWVKKNISLPNPIIFVSGNKNYEDLYLMSLCSHNVIANSSFSWWGAWLNQNTKKIVIAPKQWFKDPSIDTKDLIPERWEQV